MLFVLVRAVDVVLAKPQNFVGALSRHGVRRYVVEPRSRRLLTTESAVRLRSRHTGPRNRDGVGRGGRVEVITGIDSAGATQQLIVELFA